MNEGLSGMDTKRRIRERLGLQSALARAAGGADNDAELGADSGAGAQHSPLASASRQARSDFSFSRSRRKVLSSEAQSWRQERLARRALVGLATRL